MTKLHAIFLYLSIRRNVINLHLSQALSLMKLPAVTFTDTTLQSKFPKNSKKCQKYKTHNNYCINIYEELEDIFMFMNRERFIFIKQDDKRQCWRRSKKLICTTELCVL